MEVTNSDWLNHAYGLAWLNRLYDLANQKLCYFQIHKTWRKRQRMLWEWLVKTDEEIFFERFLFIEKHFVDDLFLNMANLS